MLPLARKAGGRVDRAGIPVMHESEVAARLLGFEEEYEMTSDDFFVRWEQGELPHTDDFFVWAGLCSFTGVKELDPA
jgi:hypothetical protein